MFKTTITLFAIFAAVAIAADHDIVPAPAAAVPAAGMPNTPAGLPAGVIIPNAQAPPAVPGAGGAPPASNPAANAPKPATNGAAADKAKDAAGDKKSAATNNPAGPNKGVKSGPAASSSAGPAASASPKSNGSEQKSNVEAASGAMSVGSSSFAAIAMAVAAVAAFH
ncbi:hypothetical protein LPJ66_000462 [Kickxella alabastrina]|uniref:Uncharacterized protein n=1 Tax=Kickxella alabastrina TaxID=61397 RepID=A0ACC1IW45_9FUNG|nr:hypothetical protein LPJ66_000462 [Kickxella alabastrina]